MRNELCFAAQAICRFAVRNRVQLISIQLVILRSRMCLYMQRLQHNVQPQLICTALSYANASCRHDVSNTTAENVPASTHPLEQLRAYETQLQEEDQDQQAQCDTHICKGLRDMASRCARNQVCVAQFGVRAVHLLPSCSRKYESHNSNLRGMNTLPVSVLMSSQP